MTFSFKIRRKFTVKLRHDQIFWQKNDKKSDFMPKMPLFRVVFYKNKEQKDVSYLDCSSPPSLVTFYGLNTLILDSKI